MVNETLNPNMQQQPQQDGIDYGKLWLWLLIKANKTNCECEICRKLREISEKLIQNL